MRVENSDILIIGAGPAGCAAAITALEGGCSVTLLERKIQSAQQPGETLHPGVEPILRQLGVWEAVIRQGFHRHRGIWRESVKGTRTFAPYGEDESGMWLGLQVDRVILNRLLRARVTELGGVIVDISRLELIRNSTGLSVAADGIFYRGGVILDGTGRHAWLAQQLGLIGERHEPAQRLRFGWRQAEMPGLDGQPLFMECSDGWEWLCPLPDRRCSWVKLACASTSGGIDYTRRIYPECTGKGYMLLGDAAFLLDPSYANGVLRALMSGIYAAALCVAVRGGRIPWNDAGHQYRAWIRRFFDTSVEAFSNPRAAQSA